LFCSSSTPFLYWGNFFTALLVPCTGVEGTAGTLPVVLALPLNLFIALSIVIASLVGFLCCLYGYKKYLNT
jgi:hypothetical protein